MTSPVLHQCDECLLTIEHYRMYNDDVCIPCAKDLGIYEMPDFHGEHERVKMERERVQEEDRQSFNKEMEAKRELAERELARRHLLSFIKRVNPEYQAGWVHADICQRLEKFARDIEAGKSPRLMITMPPRHGKQCAHSTPVLTANRGWVTHGELVVGDYVFGVNGVPIKVLALSEETESNMLVYTSSGEVIRCHENHEWTVYDRRVKKYRTVETQWLARTKLTNGEIGKRGGRYNIQLPVVKALDTSRRRNAIVKVEFSPNGEMGRCIEVDSNDGLYLVGKTLIPTHNSEIGSKTFPSWYLGRNPRHEVITCSYSGDLAKDFSRKCRDLIETELYKTTFKTRLSKDSKAVEKWATTSGGGFTAAGVQGPITGRGAHLGIIDDPVKDREEAESETTRQKIKDWYSSTFYTRLAPGGGILIIQTRWHEDDLAGWLLSVMQEVEKEVAESGGEWPADADKWELVEYPAIATEDEPYRKKGEALHEERYPLSALLRIKRTMIPRDWEALYQQRPVSDDGDYFTRNMFRFAALKNRPPINEMRIYASGDLAISTKQTADYSVFAVVGIDRQQNIWVLDIIRGRWNALGIIDRMFEIQQRWNPEIFGIETGQIELTLEPFIQKAEEERGIRLAYEKLKTRGADKGTRARPIQGRMEQGRVIFPPIDSTPWMPIVMNEMLKFPLGKNDDIVDALAWIGQMIMLFGVRNEKKVDNTPKWQEKLREFIKDGSRRRKSGMSA